jgi:uncharacterized protein YndB with AHSA1/START domain
MRPERTAGIGLPKRRTTMQRRRFMLTATAGILVAGAARGEASMAQLVTHDVISTRHVATPPDQVWLAWSEDSKVMKWWGPRPWTCPEARMDVREGGASIVCMRSPEGFEIWMRWAYGKVVTNERLEYSQNLTDRDGNLIEPTSIGMPAEFPRDVATVVTLVPDGDGTVVTITEHTTTSEALMQGSQQGLDMVMDQMAALFG